MILDNEENTKKINMHLDIFISTKFSSYSCFHIGLASQHLADKTKHHRLDIHKYVAVSRHIKSQFL